MNISATAAGRVNLIGDHTDYMGGLVLPMAIDLATHIEATTGGGTISLRSQAEPGELSIRLPIGEPTSVDPPWGRYVAAVANELRSIGGLHGVITSTIPPGAGLSSSAALEVATALALLASEEPGGPTPAALAGLAGDPREPDPTQRRELALLCQRAEHAAVGVPSGIMDQLAICAGRAGQATLIDCTDLSVTHVEVPEEAAVWVLHSGLSRRLAASAYAERRSAAEAAQQEVGPLPTADPLDIEALEDPLLRRRARHVRSECQRVLEFADALAARDLPTAGALMTASHASLRDDYEVSAPPLDDLVEALLSTSGVHGARLTGAGFGGCAVALTDAQVDLGAAMTNSAGIWQVTPSDGINVELDA